MLVLYLQEQTSFTNGGWRVLDIAPKTFRDFTIQEGKGQHIGINLDANPLTDVATDLTSAGFRDRSFDAIVCFHVLEHIPDDRAAMSEMRRMLKPSSILIAQVPLREDRPTEEDPDASPEERLRRFGKDDHVRYYGLDIVDRMTAAGFDVDVNRPKEWLSPDRYERYALAGDDQILLIAKPAR